MKKQTRMWIYAALFAVLMTILFASCSSNSYPMTKEGYKAKKNMQKRLQYDFNVARY
jgi:PBP1b-binding outer membrane lipoprotein LpoB